MLDPETWQPIRRLGRRVWDEGLWTDTFDVVPDFAAGQFCTLAMEIDGDCVKRAYSVASAPGAPMELFVVRVEGGKVSPRLHDLPEGGQVFMRRKLAGLLTLQKVDEGGTLWLIGTGTGIAPYVSMLREGTCFARHDRIVVVQSVRWGRQLAYADELRALHDAGRITWVPCVSREDVDGCERGRITHLFADGRLDAIGSLGEDDHILLCGNPDMVKEMMAGLQARGLVLRTPRRPGQIHVERFW